MPPSTVRLPDADLSSARNVHVKNELVQEKIGYGSYVFLKRRGVEPLERVYVGGAVTGFTLWVAAGC